ncbi:hypothetical protein OE88DRAFT_1732760 [Heliocybe sulcata]|uniref:Uncharacterized protein n=1 Tax=Heliocybe sulcata TaxID=5364 RepID=A0A5C3NAY6_9AGAM|nr:hypothetical protein OE88DRAFT_1732760 [Heliocybe sulcata]
MAGSNLTPCDFMHLRHAYPRGVSPALAAWQPILTLNDILRGHAHALEYIKALTASEPLPTDVKVEPGTQPSSISTAEYGYEDDSDLDDDELDPNDVDIEERGLRFQEGDVLVRHVAFKTWRAFLFFLYTEKASFNAQLSSDHNAEEDINHDAGPSSGETVESIPCSPKSMYRLANLTGMEKLQDRSLEAITSRLNEANIVPELFSRLTSSCPKVERMEMDFLQEHLTAEVTQRLTEKVRKAFTPEFSHCTNVIADVVKLLADNAGNVKAGSSGASSNSRKRRYTGDDES